MFHIFISYTVSIYNKSFITVQSIYSVSKNGTRIRDMSTPSYHVVTVPLYKVVMDTNMNLTYSLFFAILTY